MANILIEQNTMQSIADSIRTKNGTSTTYLPSEMPAAIEAITTGTGDDSAFYTMPANCQYLFYDDRFKSSYEPNQSAIDWSHVTSIGNMFYSCDNDWSNWNITIDNAVSSNYPFYGSTFAAFPKLNLTNSSSTSYQIFAYCKGADREADATADNVSLWTGTPGKSCSGFMQYSGLRFVPNCFYTYIPHNETYTSTISATSSANPYYNMFTYCRALEEILNVPLWTGATVTINSTTMLNYNQRLRRFTFETQEDGTPYTCSGYTVTLKFSGNYGYSTTTSGNGYGGGFTSTDKISSDDDYAEKKDLDDRCPQSAAYSDYNHTAAVETINSLPIVKSGTITFEGDQGSSTDGGAISDLTDEEIAVATDRNWTIAFS